eukprot:4965254-Amphidinium_carterae.1
MTSIEVGQYFTVIDTEDDPALSLTYLKVDDKEHGTGWVADTVVAGPAKGRKAARLMQAEEVKNPSPAPPEMALSESLLITHDFPLVATFYHVFLVPHLQAAMLVARQRCCGRMRKQRKRMMSLIRSLSLTFWKMMTSGVSLSSLVLWATNLKGQRTEK